MPKPKSRKGSQVVCDGARGAAMPQTINPMLATLADKPFSDPEWVFETKLDGVRAVCYIEDGSFRFISRNQLDMSHQYPELASIPEAVTASSAIIDGEIVALDEKGISRFQLLQPRLGRKNAIDIQRLAARTRLAYYVFDLLYLDGFDLTGCQLLERKATLEAIMKPSKNIRFSEHLVGEGEKLYSEVARIPLEGIIAKRSSSTYVQRRSADWLKIKMVQEMEVVVGGYTESRQSRSYFGALVVGLYDKRGLHYIAHVGGGFNERSLEQLFKFMQPLKAKECPFLDQPQTNGPVQWVKPRLVAQVKFTEWTADKRMRQPIFLRLRDDKKPVQCTFEVKRKTN